MFFICRLVTIPYGGFRGLCHLTRWDFVRQNPYLARTKVGCKYSQEKRYEEGYYDCSSLVQRCYREFGLELPSIASTQGQFMVDHGLTVDAGMLMPGDLIFYSYEDNGQFMNISHVAIYIGNGRMVHAANTARGVVEDPVNYSNINLYGRPSLYKGTGNK